jgi:hypothetical protein
VKQWVPAAALALAACTLSTGTFAGKTCDTNVDCPQPYVCAMVRPEGRTCELLRGPDTYDPLGDVPTDYCHDVKPILDRTCLANCHGSDMSYVGAPKTFRLDVYGMTGALAGAGAVASDINERMQQDTMPPQGLGLARPTLAEKAIVLRWSNTGAAECIGADAGSSDGGSGDAGSGDGGSRDAG